MQRKRPLFYLYFVALAVATGGVLFGFNLAVISGAVPFIERHFSMTPSQLGGAVSSLSFGCMVGSGFGGFLSDWLGRKRTLVGAAFLLLLSPLFTAMANDLIEFTLARLAVGLAVGLSSPVSPVYLAEISPPDQRGRLVILNQLAITLGMLLAYGTCWGLSLLGSQAWRDFYSWRLMFASAAVLAAPYLVALFFVPESPRWLAKQGLFARAEVVLARVGGMDHSQKELEEIKQAVTREEGSLAQLFRPPLRTALIIGILLMVFSQVCGVNVLLSYTPLILLKLGFQSESSALLGMGIVGLALFFATVIAISVIDRFGRRLLLLTSAAGLCCCLVLIAFQFHVTLLPPLVSLLVVVCAIGSYALGIGPGSWLVISEIFPTRLRGRATALCTLSMWIAMFGALLVSPALLEISWAGTFLLFAVTTALASVLVWQVVPETKDRSLEEIQASWRR